MAKQRKKILLVNPNTIKPPIAPVGLDYLGSSLEHAGYEVDLLDLCIAETSPEESILRSEVTYNDYLFIGVSIRNIDDSYFASRDFCLSPIARIIDLIRQTFAKANQTSPPVVLGGVGFSIFPEAVMHYCNADFGIIGDAESSAIKLADALNESADVSSLSTVPGLLVKTQKQAPRLLNPPEFNIPRFPFEKRNLVDNNLYFHQGGMIGFETKRGCPRGCIYCADPIAKGKTLRFRTPSEVADELEYLLSMGITHFHTCDSEFNIHREHLVSVCQELIRRRLGEKICWYAYCMPTPFDEEMALLMKKAGCSGIDFTVDSLDERILRYLNHAHNWEDVKYTVELCRKYHIATMLDLLLGLPGETRRTIETTLERARNISPDCVGISLGVRLYPGTTLWKYIQQQGDPASNPSIYGWNSDSSEQLQFPLLRPVFYLEHTLGEDISDYISDLVAGDSRFMFGGTGTKAKNYNYNQNQLLMKALNQGFKGAYWHILQRINQ